MTLSLRRLMSGLRGRYHLWSGLRAYRTGHIRTAGRHLDEALSCGLDSFSALLTRGKVAYRQRELTRAVECFAKARDLDPTRFSQEGFPDDFLVALREQPDRLPPLRVRITIETEARRPQRRSRSAASPRSEGLGTPAKGLGDFASRGEAERHAGQPVIPPGAGGGVDWDAEFEKLLGDG